MTRRGGLEAALSVWGEETDLSLARVLIPQGALCPDHRVLLELLIEVHLERNGDDLSRALAALRDQLSSVAGPSFTALASDPTDPDVTSDVLAVGSATASSDLDRERTANFV